MIKIGIIEDNIFLLKNFRDFLNSTEGMKVVFSCGSVEEAREQLEKRDREIPDILLLDVFLPGESGVDAIPYFRLMLPESKIVMLTAYTEDELIMNCLKKGASGYALKNTDLAHIVDVIGQITRSGAFLDEQAIKSVVNQLQSKSLISFKDELTFREKEIVALVEKGLSYKQMAEQLFVTTFTVNYHLKNIYKKLGIHSKSELLSKIMDETR